MSNTHDWFRAHLPGHLLGVLPEEHSARLFEHASECERCGAMLTRLEGEAAEGWSETEHLPVGLLRAIAANERAVEPLEQRAAEHHLERCEECRRDVAELGGLEPAIPGSSVPGVRRHVPGWLLGGIAGAFATAAALLLVFKTGVPGFAPAPREPRGAAAPAPADSGDIDDRPSMAPPRSTPVPSSVTVLRLGGTLRSPSSDSVAWDVAADRPVRIELPLLESPARTVRVELHGPQSNRIARRTLAGAALVESGFLLPAGALAPGPHRLCVSWRASEGDSDHVEYTFTIRRPE